MTRKPSSQSILTGNQHNSILCRERVGRNSKITQQTFEADMWRLHIRVRLPGRKEMLRTKRFASQLLSSTIVIEICITSTYCRFQNNQLSDTSRLYSSQAPYAVVSRQLLSSLFRSASYSKPSYGMDEEALYTTDWIFVAPNQTRRLGQPKPRLRAPQVTIFTPIL